VESAPPRPRVRRAYASSLSGLAMRCLAKKAEDRPAMTEVAAALDAAAAPRAAPWRKIGVVALAASASLFLLLVAFPTLADRAATGWFGAPAVRALRAAARAIHHAIFG
jgi:hypothetical protein